MGVRTMNEIKDERDYYMAVIERLVKIETKLDEINNFKEQLNENTMNVSQVMLKNDEQQRQIDEMRESNKWLQRAIVGAIIGALISLLFTFMQN
jgi:hypothetical protein